MQVWIKKMGRYCSHGYIKYAWFDSADWNSAVLDSWCFWKSNNSKLNATFIAMEIDEDGNSHICYDHQRDFENGYERYAVGHGFVGVEESEELRV